MKTNVITAEDAFQKALSVGKQLVDRGNANGKRINLPEIKDVFEKNLPKELRPMVTSNENVYLRAAEKSGATKEEAKEFMTKALACAFPKTDATAYFIYVPKELLNLPSDDVANALGHELLHTLSMGKTAEGKAKLREIRKNYKLGIKSEPGSDKSNFAVDVQLFLMKAFRLSNDQSDASRQELLKQLKWVKSDGQYETEQKKIERAQKCSLAYTRMALRTLFDPKLKNGETKAISKLNLPIEKSINPDAIVEKPSEDIIDCLRATLKEESLAYDVQNSIACYALGWSPAERVTLLKGVSDVLKMAKYILKGEKEILAKNP